MRRLYSEYFSLGYFNVPMFERLALISLICYVVQSARKKKPDVTYYQIVHKFTDSAGLPEELCKSLAIICEDFAYDCKEFPTFDLKGKEIISKIKEIMRSYMPF